MNILGYRVSGHAWMTGHPSELLQRNNLIVSKNKNYAREQFHELLICNQENNHLTFIATLAEATSYWVVSICRSVGPWVGPSVRP